MVSQPQSGHWTRRWCGELPRTWGSLSVRLSVKSVGGCMASRDQVAHAGCCFFTAAHSLALDHGGSAFPFLSRDPAPCVYTTHDWPGVSEHVTFPFVTEHDHQHRCSHCIQNCCARGNMPVFVHIRLSIELKHPVTGPSLSSPGCCGQEDSSPCTVPELHSAVNHTRRYANHIKAAATTGTLQLVSLTRKLLDQKAPSDRPIPPHLTPPRLSRQRLHAFGCPR